VAPPVTDVDLLGVARRVAGDARPGEQIEAYVLRSRDVDVEVFGGEVESLAVAEVEGVGVRVIVDSRQGYAWAGSLDDDVIAETLAEARDNAGFGSPDESYVLASPSDVAIDSVGAGAPVLDLWRDDVLSTPTADKVALALELEAAVRAADPLVRGVESASYGDAAVEAAVANSLGVEASTRRTAASCSAFAMAGEDTLTQTGSGFSAGRSFAEVDVHEAARDAAERAARLLGAKPIPSGRLPVILDPMVTRSLLALLGGALSGEAIVKGRSLFVGREGEAVAGPGITLVDDPTLPAAFAAATHDAEGVPTRRVELIAGGRFDAVLHNVHTAKRAGGGARTTGSAVRGGFKSPPGVGARALHLVPGAIGAEEILASVDHGLYVQSVSGLHSGTNPVSGDFSVGAVGLVVRGGALAEPVREVTIASTLQRILHDITVVGADLTWLPGGAAGMTLLISDMSVSGA
jgi:PmbA protein